MATNCTRCEGTGFLNFDQVPEHTKEAFDKTGDHDLIFKWIDETDEAHDVQVCDCCGDGESWYGVPGEHYNSSDPRGPLGPYAANGGLCQCH